VATYLQLGHESWSLLTEPDIGQLVGAVLSPVNDSPATAAARIRRLRDRRATLELVLDPQLYNPSAERGELANWSYYSAEFETGDHGDLGWWQGRARAVVDAARALHLDAVCSPAMFPNEFSDDYYRFIVEIGDATYTYARAQGIDALLTVIVELRSLSNPVRAMSIASIISQSECERIYVVVVTAGTAGKEPVTDTAGLATAIHLLRLLKPHLRVHIAFCGHDVVLWKFAGATDVSTGKWMNVRRFTPGRWQEKDDQEGRQVAYWNEGSLLTLIRDQEFLRLDRLGWYPANAFVDNPSSRVIADQLRGGSPVPWLKLSWVQYLRWVSNVESSWRDPVLAEEALEHSDRRWREAMQARILFVDRYNDGAHVRSWINAVREGGAR